MRREALLVEKFVELTGSLIGDFDPVELMTQLTAGCVDVLELSAAGIMLAADDRQLHVVASSTHAMRLLELFELQSDEGPCLDCFRSGAPVVNEELLEVDSRWPRFSPRALEAGFRSAHALPMRWQGQMIGALNLFGEEVGSLSVLDTEAAQGFADVATIAVLQHRSHEATKVVNAQLVGALDSRVAIEQAKGIVSQALGIDMPEAFELLRRQSRRSNVRLSSVAGSLVSGSLLPSALGSSTRGPTTELASGPVA